MIKRCIKIFNSFQSIFKPTIRKVSNDTKIPKSSVHRAVKKIEERNLYPESHLWETEEGQAWLARLILSIIFIFGIKEGSGAKNISLFFKMIRLDKHFGVSESSILREKNKMIDKINEFGEIQKESCASDNAKKIVAAADETFFKKMILVFMDLRSGFIFSEKFSEKRDYDAWMKQTNKALKDFSVEVVYAVTDRAKALIKLAEDGFKVFSIPDLFHAARDICKPFGRYFGSKIHSIQKQIQKEKEALEKIECTTKKEDISKRIEALTVEEKELEAGKKKYDKIKHEISTAAHPFDVETLAPKSSEEIEKALQEAVKNAKELKEKYSINDDKKCIKKFENQIEGLSNITTPWWDLVYESMPPTEFDDKYTDWIMYVLLPYAYFKSANNKNQNSKLKDTYNGALNKAFQMFQNHSHTKKYMSEELFHWSEWIVSMYQRTSSAIEGRNGYLSQIHHSGRRLSSKNLDALTTISNFFVRRADGRTPAERLFEKEFPDMFEWLIENMDELPCPRKRWRKKTSDRNLLNLNSVPA